MENIFDINFKEQGNAFVRYFTIEENELEEEKDLEKLTEFYKSETKDACLRLASTEEFKDNGERYLGVCIINTNPAHSHFKNIIYDVKRDKLFFNTSVLDFSDIEKDNTYIFLTEDKAIFEIEKYSEFAFEISKRDYILPIDVSVKVKGKEIQFRTTRITDRYNEENCYIKLEDSCIEQLFYLSSNGNMLDLENPEAYVHIVSLNAGKADDAKSILGFFFITEVGTGIISITLQKDGMREFAYLDTKEGRLFDDEGETKEYDWVRVLDGKSYKDDGPKIIDLYIEGMDGECMIGEDLLIIYQSSSIRVVK